MKGSDRTCFNVLSRNFPGQTKKITEVAVRTDCIRVELRTRVLTNT